MNKEELIKTLQGQASNLKKFIKVLEDKQHAIIENDYDLLSVKMNDEEIMIGKIKKEDDKRLTLMKSAFNNQNINNNSDLMNVSLFIERTKQHWEEEELEILSQLLPELKELASEADKINEQNRYLIQNARSFIREIISAVVNAQKRSLIDRKI